MIVAWQDIWHRRGLIDAAPRDLQRLLEIDGFDAGAGRLGADDLRDYLRTMAARLGIRDGATVYEVGCGAGALLFGLREQFEVAVGGCDYAAPLVDLARQVLPDADVTVAEAAALAVEPVCDVVIAKSVFQYFPTLEYADRVVAAMIAKARFAVGILEVPDVQVFEEAERARRDEWPPDVYAERYRGLEHRYYAPEWFGAIATKHGCSWESLGHSVPSYAQSAFRFDVVIRKPDRTPDRDE